MRATELWFDGRGRVELREADLPGPGPGQVLVETRVSAISAGSELLFYRGELRGDVPIDVSLDGYRSHVTYPLRYGYASVGTVIAVGPGVDPGLAGRLVFSFSPHASAFIAAANDVLPVPPGMGEDDAAFLANAETAVTLVLDGQPRLSDRVSVLGLGVVGLLTTAILSRFPLSRLLAYDPYALRREAAAVFGAQTADPFSRPPQPLTEDVVFELTGSPDALGTAVTAAAFSGLVVIGSWYGARPFFSGLSAEAPVLNTAFHRGRVRLLASQVSTLDPQLSGRWDRKRRLSAAWDAITTIRPSRWVTHRFPLSCAADAYALLAGRPSEVIQVLLVHDRPG